MLTAVCQFNVIGAAQKNGDERRWVLEDWLRSARATVSAGAWTVSCANDRPDNDQRS